MTNKNYREINQAFAEPSQDGTESKCISSDLAYQKIFTDIEHLLLARNKTSGDDLEKIDAILKERFATTKNAFDQLGHSLATQSRDGSLPTKK